VLHSTSSSLGSTASLPRTLLSCGPWLSGSGGRGGGGADGGGACALPPLALLQPGARFFLITIY